jgi:hypothetical protein
MVLGEQTPEQQLEQAAQLIKVGDRAGAITMLERLAQTQESAITAGQRYGLPKDLNAAERAAYALMLLIRVQLSTLDEEWSDDDWTVARRTVDRLLAIGKLIKKRYETKVRILLEAADALAILGEDQEARTHLQTARQFYDQQLRHLAESSYPLAAAVELKQFKERLERELLAEAVEQQITFTVEAASESELKLILMALERGQGVWTIPKRYTVKQTTNSPRAGRRFQAPVKLAIRAALKDTG